MDELNTTAPMGDTDQQPEQTETTQPDTAATTDFMNNPDVLAFIEKQVNEGIQKALKGTRPRANTVAPSETEKAQFEKMSYKERLKLFQSNPQSYQKLAKGSM